MSTGLILAFKVFFQTSLSIEQLANPILIGEYEFKLWLCEVVYNPERVAFCKDNRSDRNSWGRLKGLLPRVIIYMTVCNDDQFLVFWETPHFRPVLRRIWNSHIMVVVTKFVRFSSRLYSHTR